LFTTLVFTCFYPFVLHTGFMYVNVSAITCPFYVIFGRLCLLLKENIRRSSAPAPFLILVLKLTS
jgi:hypothetical protein